MDRCYTCQNDEARWITGQVRTCTGCAAKYEAKLGITPVLIPTVEQITAAANWGAGIN